MNLLQLDGVHAYYGEAQVLHDLSISVDRGERVAILGRNGVGKTTVVNSCTGIARVHKGRISFAGETPSTIRHFTAARCGIAFVPQGRRIVPGLTVEENLLLGAAVGRKGPWTVDTVCELFPILRERADRPRHRDERRPAADAGDRPRADGQSGAAGARRAERGPRAGDRRRARRDAGAGLPPGEPASC